MAKKREALGNVQLEVLQYIADNHPARVADVAEYFARTSGRARTTILTVMERLRKKGYLTRRKRKGAFHYSPKQSKSELLTGVVERFVDQSLGGSASPVIAWLAESRDLTDEELAKLRELVRELESQSEDDA